MRDITESEFAVTICEMEYTRLLIAEERYEKVRKLNVVQFKKLYDQSIITGQPFDWLVDGLTFD